MNGDELKTLQDYITMVQAARALGVVRTTVSRMVTKGMLPAIYLNPRMWGRPKKKGEAN